MSYDIYFAKRRPGQTWDEVLAELEEAAERDLDDVPLTPELLAALAAVGTMSAIATELRDVPGGYTGRGNDDTPDASPR